MFCKHSLQSHRRWQTNQVEAELALKAGCGLVAPSLDHSTFHRAWGRRGAFFRLPRARTPRPTVSPSCITVAGANNVLPVPRAFYTLTHLLVCNKCNKCEWKAAFL